jgi:hypothetical protein
LLWIFITYINILPNYWLCCRGCVDIDILLRKLAALRQDIAYLGLKSDSQSYIIGSISADTGESAAKDMLAAVSGMGLGLFAWHWQFALPL